jgi:hypothetical protein
MPVPSTNWTIRIFKSWGSNDLSRAWANNYEVNTTQALNPPDLQPVVDTLVAAEKTIHMNNIQFIQATISTWEPDSKPYNPLSFLTVPLAGTGSSTPNAGDDMLDSNVTLMIRYQATTGRSGRRFYRGLLTEAAVNSTSQGYFQLIGGAAWGPTGTIITNVRTQLAPLLPGGNGIGKLMLMYAKPGVSSVQRAVTAVALGGVVINRRNHRYFDRT